MSDWREVTLGEFLQVRHGFAFKGEHFRDDGELVVLTPGNFHDGGGFKVKSEKRSTTAARFKTGSCSIRATSSSR